MSELLIIRGCADQSNGRGKAPKSSVPNSGIYASYFGLVDSDELRDGSSNNVYTYSEDRIVQATVGNYGVNVLGYGSMQSKTARDTQFISNAVSLVKRLRAYKDSVGDNDDIFLYQSSVGGIKTTNDSATYDLNASTGELFKHTLDAVVENVLPTMSDPEIFIMMCVGESEEANAANALLAYQVQIDTYTQIFGKKVKVILEPPTWDRPNIIAAQNTLIANNDNVHSGFGADLDAYIDKAVLDHNATGISPTGDRTTLSTYTQADEIHLDWWVQLQYGFLDATKIISLGASTPVVPGIPTSLALTTGTQELTVAFVVSSMAISYTIAYKLSSDPTFTEAIVFTNSEILSGLTGDVPYDVKVKANGIAGDSAYSSVVVGTPDASSSGREADAAGHWFFGSDNPTYLDIDGGNALTAPSSSPTINSNSIQTANTGITSGFETPFTEILGGQTQWMVCKLTKQIGGTNVVTGGVILGNVGLGAANGGISIFQQRFYSSNTNGDYGDLIITDRGATADPSVKEDPSDDYIFVAWSLNGSVKETFYMDAALSTPVTDSVAGFITASSPTINLGFGNTSYNHTNYPLGVTLAEGGIINGYKTTAELTAIYDRSVIRLAARSITV